VKRSAQYIVVLALLLYNYGFAAENCDTGLFDIKTRSYNTLFISTDSTTMPEKEGSAIKNLVIRNIKRLPNNKLYLSPDIKVREKEKAVTVDRIITINISKTVIRKERYAGDTGKERYLIIPYQAVSYDFDIELKDAQRGVSLYRYKKHFKQKDLNKCISEFYSEIKPFYSEPLKYCVPKNLKEYFLNIYILNGFPVADYRELLSYSAGIGGMFGVTGAGIRNSVFSLYLETAWNTTDNPDINYALTLHAGAGAGYRIVYSCFNIIPQLSFGRIYSFYNVKYSDMETFYRNSTMRCAMEFNTDIYNKTFFIQPAFTTIFEKGNTLHSVDLILGIKLDL
jgi:hypothetical protein